MADRKPTWLQVAKLAQEHGLADALNSVLVIGPKSATWHNVVPRTRQKVDLSLVEAGIMIKASRTNSEDMPDLRARIHNATLPMSEDLIISELRYWESSRHATCIIKPCLLKKRQGKKVEVTFAALQLIVKAVQERNAAVIAV